MSSINIKIIQKNITVLRMWNIGYSCYIGQKFLIYTFTYILAMDLVLIYTQYIMYNNSQQCLSEQYRTRYMHMDNLGPRWPMEQWRLHPWKPNPNVFRTSGSVWGVHSTKFPSQLLQPLPTCPTNNQNYPSLLWQQRNHQSCEPDTPCAIHTQLHL